ncbi:hypothetical protein [Pedobacter montanisoli]|uniref:Uncharacterized protein n=1 Tax=Pedobacter montanisoli TaxID=2923277 RepID=A0ABS9ZXS8_9SPHI|nr:hypothetical protein [Pedobacter montanisoli]MCJ0743118.1 hypothetical protein [Pedobacter montanisoli]
MAQIPPISDAYIDDIIKSYGPYIDAINKTQGIKFRELIKRLRDYFEQEIPKNTSQLVNDSNYVTSPLISGLPEESGSRRPFIIRALTSYNPDEIFGIDNQPLHVMLVATELIAGKETVTQLKISDGITAFKNLKNLIGGGGSGENGLQPSISLTYTQLRNLKDNALLVPGQKYIINDFQSTFNECELLYDNVTKINSLNFTDNVYSGDVEPIIVTAAGVDTLEPLAYSTIYPEHILEYTTDNLLQEVLASTKGTILYRRDVSRNNYFSLDMVALKYKYNETECNAVDFNGCYNTTILAISARYLNRYMFIVRGWGVDNASVSVNSHFVVCNISDTEIINSYCIAPFVNMHNCKINGLFNFNKSSDSIFNNLSNLEITADYNTSASIVNALNNYLLDGHVLPGRNIPKPYKLLTVFDRLVSPAEYKNYILSVDVVTGNPIAIPLFESP